MKIEGVYKDHLGNVRLTYADTDGNGSINPSSEIISEKNYYPFGLQHKGYNVDVSANVNSVAQNFGYNGKENNPELGIEWMDFGARNYDPALGRWFSIDPVADIEPSLTPYRFAFNNPLSYIDPDGKYEWRVNTETGEFKKFGDKGDDKHQHIYLNDATEAFATFEGSEIFVGATKIEGGEDGDIGFEISTVDLWSDVPDEYQGAYTSNELKTRYRAQKERGHKYDLIRKQEQDGRDPNDMYWDNTEYSFQLIHRYGNDSGLVVAADTGMLQTIVDVGMNADPGIKISGRQRQNSFTPNFKPTSTLSSNTWIRFLQVNKGKYKGKGYGRGWIKKAAQDYQIAKQQGKL